MNLVYCRDCAHAKPHSTAADMYYCDRTHMRMSAEDFCSRGEKKGEKHENQTRSGRL